MEERTDRELRELAFDSRASKEERARAKEILEKRGPSARSVPKKKTPARTWLGIVAILLVANPCTLAIAIRVVLFEAFEIDGPSSAPTYDDGDRVVVSKYEYGLFLPFTNEAMFQWGAPHLGDVVILRSPLDDIDIIKRIVGMPGDTIAIEDDAVIRNGHPVPRRELGPATGDVGDGVICYEETLGDVRHPLLEHLDVEPDDMPRITIPAGHVFVLGDNRDRSNDSRRIGTVPFARLKGRVLAHYVTEPNRIECPE